MSRGGLLAISRLLRGALLVLVSLSSLTCSRSSEEGREIVELWALGREGEVVQELVPGFERAHPGVRVRVQQIPWSAAHEKLLTAFAGDSLPDVVQLGNTWVPEFAALGAIEPLDERLKTSPTLRLDDFFPGVLAANVVDGTTWALPWYADTRLLFYRRDLVRDAGGDDPPRTWDAWLEAMLRLRGDAGKRPRDTHPILLPLGEWEPPVIFALQRGAVLLRDDGRFGNFRSAEFRGAFRFYLDLFEKSFAPRAGQATIANLYQDFGRGSFAFFLSGPWSVGELQRRLPASFGDRWATAPMPAAGVAGSGVSIAGGASLAIVRKSERKDDAWALLTHLVDTPQQIELHRETGDLPSRTSAWDDASLTGNPHARAFREQLGRVVPAPQVPEWERIAAEIGRFAEDAVRGVLSEDEALAALDASADAILEKRRWLLARRERVLDSAR